MKRSELPPHSDLVRSPKTGRLLTRHPHDKGPCLFDQMTEWMDQYRRAKGSARDASAEAVAARQRARQHREAAKTSLAMAVQAGLDLGLSYREIAEHFGVSASTLHLAHQESPIRAEPGKQPDAS